MIDAMGRLVLVWCVAIGIVAIATHALAYGLGLKISNDTWRRRDWWVLATFVLLAPPFWIGGGLSPMPLRVGVVCGCGVALAIAIVLSRRLYRVATVLTIVTAFAALLLIPEPTSLKRTLLNVVIVPIPWLITLLGAMRFDTSPPCDLDARKGQ